MVGLKLAQLPAHCSSYNHIFFKQKPEIRNCDKIFNLMIKWEDTLIFQSFNLVLTSQIIALQDCYQSALPENVCVDFLAAFH